VQRVAGGEGPASGHAPRTPSAGVVSGEEGGGGSAGSVPVPRLGRRVGDSAAASELILDATARPRLRQALRELWAFRGTMLAFAERDVRLKYKQAVLGVAWALLQPLALLTIFAVFFGWVAKISGDGMPYAAFALTALIPWTYIATTVSFGSSALLSDASLVRRVYFPREVPVIAAAVAAVVDFFAGLVAFLILGPILGAHLSWTALLVPLLLPLVAVPALGLSLALAALNVYYRDFRYALPLGIQLWMFASPVVYPITKIPSKWQTLYAFLNPAAGPLEGFRRVLGLGTLPPTELLLASLGGGVLWLWLGYRLFKAMEPNFADVI
jgi:lipopolysaccharide transport system permease protein